MKLKALLLMLCTAGIAVSLASAAVAEKGRPAPAGSSTTTTTTAEAKGKEKAKAKAVARAQACKPAKKIVVTGEFVAAATGGFAMKVSGGNNAAKPWKGKQATVLVDEKTRFNGKKKGLAEIAAGDRVNVQGHSCKADVAAGSLLARKVTSKAPKGADGEDDKATTATTTTATTTAP